ncbi:MAG: class I SAM-dependent methyltransferase, partial [Planctomycetota bacterium]
YVRHQKLKFQKMPAANREFNDRRLYACLKSRFESLNYAFKGKSVICLGARQGTEVRVFTDFGCLAIGIDLNPGPENKYVVYGDFRDIQYPDNVFDIAYTNSLDHSWDIIKTIAEILRVVKPGGVLIIDAMEGGRVGQYEALDWESSDRLIELFIKRNCVLMNKFPISQPWSGTCFLLINGD